VYDGKKNVEELEEFRVQVVVVNRDDGEWR
jgi:hypothetical protein